MAEYRAMDALFFSWCAHDAQTKKEPTHGLLRLCASQATQRNHYV